MTCKTCNGTGLYVTAYWQSDCATCISDSVCPRCDKDDNDGYTDGEGFLWDWDGTTPCQNCGWQRDQKATNDQPAH